MEKLIFPMKYLNITQGVNGSFSHQGTNEIDNAGKDTGIDPIFAPCTMKHVWRDSAQNGNAVFFESVNKVMFADGTVDYAKFMFIHDNYIGDYKVGQVFKQGQEFGDEGTAGRATGNHSHISVGKGKFNGRYYVKNNKGVWMMPDNIHPKDAFFLTPDIKVINDLGYNFLPLNGWHKDSNCWYYLEDGVKASGWKFIKESKNNKAGWYYFNPANNIMQSNKYINDPKGKCWVDSSGLWDGKYH